MGRPRRHKQTTRLSVSFEKADYDRVNAIAEANDVATAWIIPRAVSAHLDACGPSVVSTGLHDEQQQEIASAMVERQSQ